MRVVKKHWLVWIRAALQRDKYPAQIWLNLRDYCREVADRISLPFQFYMCFFDPCPTEPENNVQYVFENIMENRAFAPLEQMLNFP